ncbi:MAG: zinc-ribbon domain-containing protein [Deltaproteobacteria bacterium]|nr:zinc-ribbon domain-containing protein [Deltaproteobacteria bacterium]
MIITCKACNASFNLNESLLKPEGSKVRCSKCKKVFMAYPPAPPEEAKKPDEMLSGLDLELEQETKDSETGQLDDSEFGELDLPDLEKLFAEEEVPEGQGDTDEGIEDFELDLDFEPESEKAPEHVEAEAKPGEPDEFDLSDMEDLLDITQVPEKQGDADEAIEDFELDLELDMDFEPESEKAPEPVEAQSKIEEPDILDLSDIEELLDLEAPATQEKDGMEPEELELELDTDMEPEIEKVSEDDEASVEPEALEEIDLSDIEMMFDTEEEETEEEAEPVDSPLVEETSGTELDEIEAVADKLETVEFSETEEIEQKFEIEDTDEDDLSEEEIVDEQPVVATAKPKVKKRISKPLIVLLILVLLGGGGYGIYVLLDFMNIEIPFVSNYFKPQISDPAGNLKIDTLDVESAFAKNAKTGKLFVITGKIKNGYSDTHSYIRVTGKLYTKGKILVQEETVFCGNVLSDIELSNLELSAIKKRLSNRIGDNNSNIGVKSGQELPFMIVFSKLPGNLEEFAVEAEGSVPG